MDKKEIQITLEPVQLALTTAFINNDQENFSMIMVSGNQGRTYILSPMHAKRLQLALQKQISDYENKFGELKTELPKDTGGQTSGSKMGFA